jgi:ribosomal protein L40E
MKSIKCKSCGLTNFPDDVECRRCRTSFVRADNSKRQRSPRSFSFGTLLLVALGAGIGYYFYTGVSAEVKTVNNNEANRLASEPAERPATPGLSRTQYDKQRSGHYGDAVRQSQSLKDHVNRGRETEKAIQQVSNSR